MPRKRSDRPRQRRYDPLAVLAYVAAAQQRRPQRSPSERQIQRALGISSSSVVHAILRRLEQATLLAITRYGPGYAPDLLLTAAGQQALQRWQAEHGPAAGNETDEGDVTPTEH